MYIKFTINKKNVCSVGLTLKNLIDTLFSFAREGICFHKSMDSEFPEKQFSKEWTWVT